MCTALTKDVSKENQHLADKVFDFLFQTLSIDEKWSVRDETGFTWWPHRLAQRVWFEPVDTPDGSPYIRVHAETCLFRNVPNTNDTAQRIDLFNMFASMNAFIWDSIAGRVALHCSAYISEATYGGGLKTALAAAIAIQAADANIKASENVATLIKAEVDESLHINRGIRQIPDDMLYVIERGFAPMGSGSSPFTESDFESVVRMEPNPWVLATADESGFTVEFPYIGKTPAVGMAMGFDKGPTQTALLRASAKEVHPQLGSGVLLRMTLPAEFDRDEAITAAHELNQAETCEHTLSYFIGAWCNDPHLDRVCFVTFLPASIRKANLLNVFVVSMWCRCLWARERLSRRASASWA